MDAGTDRRSGSSTAPRTAADRSLRAGATRALRGAVVIAVRAYQATLSRLIGPACRYEPSCSQYMIDAVRRRGLLRGAALGLARLARCHPWGGCGYDPVPCDDQIRNPKLEARNKSKTRNSND